MPHEFRNPDLEWNGNTLRVRWGKYPTVDLVPDPVYPKMWRVRYPDGKRSDILNRTRARDAAKTILCAILNNDPEPHSAPPMRSASQPVGDIGPEPKRAHTSLSQGLATLACRPLQS